MTFLFWVFVAATAGLVLLPVSIELGARLWLRRRGRYYVFPPGLRLLLHPDPEVFPELEPVVRFEINAEGERGNEVPRCKRGERLYRVLVAGGSQPEGYLLDQATFWPGALQRLLQQPASASRLGAANVHVGSIARSGVGSEALELVLERVLPRYPRLDAIIILVGASDVLQWLEQGAPPAPPTSPRVQDVFMCHPEGLFRWRPNELAAVELLRRARRRWLRPVEVHNPAGRWIGNARAMRARAPEILTTTSDPSPMLDYFETYFRRLVQRAQTHADRVLVIEQPWFAPPFRPEEAAHMWHGGTGQAWRSDVTAYYSFEVVSRLMARLNRRARRVAKALDVEDLDLMPILDRNLETYYDGFHATPAGAKDVAAAVAAAILRQPLPPGPRLESRPLSAVPTEQPHEAAVLS
jgi:lysophospholipase L1-like esterase